MAAGAAAHRRNDKAEAARYFRQALRHDPKCADAWNNLGVLLRGAKKDAAAIACYRRALAVRPDNPGSYSNLGNALRELGRFGDAANALNRALELRPEYPEALNNLGLVYRDDNKPEQALQYLDRALALRPDYMDCQWDRSLILLTLERLREGFAAYECRWKLDRSPPRPVKLPLWKGESLKGKTIFLHDEQGFGDVLMFARFMPELARMGAKMVVECQPELQRLLAGVPGVIQTIPRRAPYPAADCYAPLLSVPHILGTEAETLPRDAPYLRPIAPPPRPLPQDGRLRVGVCWAGKTTPRDRSVPLESLLPLTANPRTAFYSLQMGPRAKDLETQANPCLITDITPDIGDFADTAAMLAQLDLLISNDTAIVHLAGAMGVPTWVLLLYTSDWRWGGEGERTIWYPSLRLFRQHRTNDWSRALAQLTQAFAAWAEDPASGWSRTNNLSC